MRTHEHEPHETQDVVMFLWLLGAERPMLACSMQAVRSSGRCLGHVFNPCRECTVCPFRTVLL